MRKIQSLIVAEILYGLVFSTCADPSPSLPIEKEVQSQIKSDKSQTQVKLKKPTASLKDEKNLRRVADSKSPEPLINKNPDLTSLDKSLPIKDTPTREIELPGLMRIPGASAQMIDPSRGQVVEFVDGGSSSVYASNSDINLIQLPFTSPLITSTDEIEIKQSGSNIYFQFKNSSKRSVQLFVENQTGSSSVLSLQLIPKSIVSQVIKIVDNSARFKVASDVNKSSDYIGKAQALLEDAANNQSPQGFTKIPLSHISPIVLNGLVITPISRFSNFEKEIFIYEALNPNTNLVTLNEKEFDGESVLAISIFPTPILRKGDKTRILILSKKQLSKRPF
jgi:conjugal transfer pilus assembly protein TraK